MCVYDKDDPPISLVFWPRASSSQVVISIHLFFVLYYIDEKEATIPVISSVYILHAKS